MRAAYSASLPACQKKFNNCPNEDLPPLPALPFTSSAQHSLPPELPPWMGLKPPPSGFPGFLPGGGTGLCRVNRPAFEELPFLRVLFFAPVVSMAPAVRPVHPSKTSGQETISFDGVLRTEALVVKQEEFVLFGYHGADSYYRIFSYDDLRQDYRPGAYHRSSAHFHVSGGNRPRAGKLPPTLSVVVYRLAHVRASRCQEDPHM